MGIMGYTQGEAAAQRSRAKAESPGEDYSRENAPDLTLPLVEMAEIERPVMDVTMTDSRMMSQVSTVGGNANTPKLNGETRVSPPGSHVT